MKTKIIFITGTDTGVGKTLFTGLLLDHLRQGGHRALAMKPFCSGTRDDVDLLQSLQPGELSAAEMNPFYFPEPIAPLVAAKKRRKSIRLEAVIARIQRVQSRCDVLLIEGSGGLLVPLGKGFTVADLIAQLDCQVVVLARNRLGTINHTLLTVGALQQIDKEPLAVVLMCGSVKDLSSRSNCKILAELLDSIGVFEVPFLGRRCFSSAEIKKGRSRAKKPLDFITKSVKFR